MAYAVQLGHKPALAVEEKSRMGLGRCRTGSESHRQSRGMEEDEQIECVMERLDKASRRMMEAGMRLGVQSQYIRLVGHHQSNRSYWLAGKTCQYSIAFQ